MNVWAEHFSVVITIQVFLEIIYTSFISNQYSCQLDQCLKQVALKIKKKHTTQNMLAILSSAMEEGGSNRKHLSKCDWIHYRK